ncbi:MAG: hypothetical protein CFE44_03360 [Burkholderiales bacterium PBB4]|nr:MAG: hypothetical protein CFE44_03360 [Burkholderiales bacterium PBB4]
MALESRFSTTTFAPQMFKPHGRIESSVVGNLFVQEATGPFNKEILLAMEAVHAGARQLAASDGVWAAIFVFKQSALASPEMLNGLSKYLATQVTRRNASTATALVMPADVEGALLMAPLYLRAWQRAGISCEVFSGREDAERWLATQLGQMPRK